MLASRANFVSVRTCGHVHKTCFTAARHISRCNALAIRASTQNNTGATPVDRRAVLLTGMLLTGSTTTRPAVADDEAPAISTFYGMATPPTSYGGYGGNANEKPKYAFEYPTGWKSDVINKVEKGTQGIDGRVYNPRNKSEQVFVITLSRAGEDANFALRDIDSTFAGFAGADYGLQDALTTSTNKVSSQRTKDGQLYYDVLLDSPDITYLSTITVAEGKVFAMFTKVPTKTYKANESKYKGIVESFRLL